MLLFLRAEAIGQDICRRGKVLHSFGIRAVLFAQELGILLEIAVVLRDIAQRFQTQNILHVFQVHQSGPHKQFQNCHAHTGHQAQQAEDDPEAGIAAATHQILCLRGVDDRHRAHHQRLRQDRPAGVQNGVHQPDAGVRIVPAQSELKDLCLVVPAHLQILVNILRRDRHKARAVKSRLQYTVALHHKTCRVYHILRQMEVVGAQVGGVVGKGSRR